MGLHFVRSLICQPGGNNVVLTLCYANGDGNCLFQAMSLVTGCENQHMQVRNAILRYMSSIENLVVGYDSHGSYNYLQPLGAQYHARLH